FLPTRFRNTTSSIFASVPRRWNGAVRRGLVSAKLLFQLGCSLFLKPCASSCTSCPSALRSTFRCRSSSSSSFTRSKLFTRTVPLRRGAVITGISRIPFHNFHPLPASNSGRRQGEVPCLFHSAHRLPRNTSIPPAPVSFSNHWSQVSVTPSVTPCVAPCCLPFLVQQ